MHAVHEAQARKRDMLTYCLHIKEQLHTPDMDHKRRTLEALDIRVIWTPGAPLDIAGIIPLGEPVQHPGQRVRGIWAQ